MNNTTTIAIDIDECLSDTYPLMMQAGKDLGYEPLTTSEYHPRAWFGVDGVELAAVQRLIDSRLASANPVVGAKCALDLIGKEFTLVALTGRSADRHGEATEKFLERNFPGIFERVVYADQEGANLSKGELALAIGARALVDDLPIYVTDVAEHGVPVVHLNRGQDWQHTVQHLLVREAASWNQVPGLLGAVISQADSLLVTA